jgi:predicted ATP-grasp superfamily ATP-dependent carboligase
MKRNVLVFPCGSEIGLEVYKSVKDSIHFNLIGGSSVGDHGEFIFENYIGDVPMIDDPDFMEKLNDVIRENDIHFVFPAHDSVVLKLAQEEAAGNLACKAITSPVETCEVARSKKKTYEVLDGIIPTPKVYDIDNLTEADLPVFLKPDVGQGSKGTYKAKTMEDVRFYASKDSSLLALEYLPGKEYTVDCYTNGDGELLMSEGRQRTRIANGISVRSEVVEDPRFSELAKAINQKLAFWGAWFFQVKEADSGELVLMEIAPRIAGTMGLERARGVNLPLLNLFEAIGVKISITKNDYAVVIDRALENRYKHNVKYKHVYIDFDDLLVTEGIVYPEAMAFVYQCINKGVTLHLITRHRDDLHANLKKYRLEGVFDEIIWVKEGEEKHTYIKEKDAIFIDDSFAERKKVQDACGIPTFDNHMLEVLREY